MHYYVDGYNLLFRLTDSSGPLQQQREALLEDLTSKLNALSVDCTIIFDAMHAEGPQARHHLQDVEVVYTSPGETADRYILEVLYDLSNPHRHTIVTSDRELARQARQLGAKTLDVAPFMRWVNARCQKLHLKVAIEKRKTKEAGGSSGPASPVSGETSSKSQDPYQSIFEERLQKLEEREPTTPIVPRATIHESKKDTKDLKDVKDSIDKEVTVDDQTRWLEAFEGRLEHDSDNDNDNDKW